MTKLSLYQTGLIDEMPSRVWKKVLMEEAEELAKKTEIVSVKKIVNMNDYKNIIATIEGYLKRANSKSEIDKIAQIYDYISVIYALETSFEFVVDNKKTSDVANEHIDKMKEFKMPFEGMLINYRFGDKYSSSFVSCIKMEEKFIRNNVEYDIFIINSS